MFGACALSIALGAYSAETPPQHEANMSDRDPLAQLVEPINAEVARLIRDPATTIERLDTPFLRNGLIFQVEWHGPYKPVGLTVGYARQDNFTVLLPANTAGFQELAARAGVVLDSGKHRVAYAITELETTRPFDETFVVLRSFDDLRPMANPTAQDEARFRAIRQKYEPLIQLPRADGAAPWAIPVYVLARNDLCLFTVTLDAAGISTIDRQVLEANAPLLPAG
jgi:hypothetical protein